LRYFSGSETTLCAAGWLKNINQQKNEINKKMKSTKKYEIRKKYEINGKKLKSTIVERISHALIFKKPCYQLKE